MHDLSHSVGNRVELRLLGRWNVPNFRHDGGLFDDDRRAKCREFSHGVTPCSRALSGLRRPRGVHADVRISWWCHNYRSCFLSNATWCNIKDVPANIGASDWEARHARRILQCSSLRDAHSTFWRCWAAFSHQGCSSSTLPDVAPSFVLTRPPRILKQEAAQC